MEVLMDYPLHKTMRLLILITLMSAAVGFSAPVLSLFEGRVGATSKANGYFDLRLQFWDHADKLAPRLFQTIEIPHVLVKDGRFGISLDAGLESKAEADLAVKIQVRAFESWKPFEPAEISRCLFRVGLGKSEAGSRSAAILNPIAPVVAASSAF
jgi:hypothetical protein